jgi:hypothetical protein
MADRHSGAQYREGGRLAVTCECPAGAVPRGLFVSGERRAPAPPHPHPRAYVERRTKEGLSKKDIMRCLKRFVARKEYYDQPGRITQSSLTPVA